MFLNYYKNVEKYDESYKFPFFGDGKLIIIAKNSIMESAKLFKSLYMGRNMNSKNMVTVHIAVNCNRI